MQEAWRDTAGAARDRRTEGDWRAIAGAARAEFGAAVTSAIAAGRLDRAARHRWLAAEAALCRISALALESLSAWHATQPVLQATALAWASAFHADGRAAAAGARGIAAAMPLLPAQVGPWKAFLRSACTSARAGEALGAVACHAALGCAPLCAFPANAEGFPDASDGCGYLARRGQRAPGDGLQCDALLDAYAAAALAAGAQRARDWYRLLLDDVLTPVPRAGAEESGGVGNDAHA